MIKEWVTLRSEFPEGQQCIFKGPGCTGLAEQGDHTLHKVRKGEKAMREGLTRHLDSIYNFGPSCAVCNSGKKYCDTTEGKERGMEWLVNEHGKQKIVEWADGFPEYMKFPGSEWEDMMFRLVQYRGME